MVTLAEVFRQYWPEYQRQFGAQILPSHQRAAQAIMACRTRALGGEVYRCDPCQQDHFVYHSCHHRACPQCGYAEGTAWLERHRLKLLPVPYYLITFTVPEGLRPWLRSHQKQGYGGLLRESAATLQDVARRDKYLGAELGILSVFHPVGRQLQFHPHVHCVVPAGGLRADGLGWCRPRSPDFFLPQIVLAARFRTRLKTALYSAPEASEIPASVWRQKWVVDVQPVGSGQPALKYLAAYLYRPPLGSHSLQEANGQVTFPYEDHQDKTRHSLTLPVLEFIRRFLHLVLPKGFQRTRTYGWLSAAAKVRWQRILTLLDWTVSAPPAAAPRTPPCCPHCNRPLRWLTRWGRGPP